MRATNDAYVSTSEAADVTATKTATASRKGGTTSRGYSNHRGCGDCENFAVNLGFHNLAPFSLVLNQSWVFVDPVRILAQQIDLIVKLHHWVVSPAWAAAADDSR